MSPETETVTVGELRERLVERAVADETFRSRLLSDPRATIGAELELEVPPGFTVEVHEESADVAHVVLPPLRALDDAGLEQVVGGFSSAPESLSVKNW